MAGAQGTGQGSVMQSFGRLLGRSVRGFTRGLMKGGSTPTRLRAWMAGTVVVAVLFGVLGALGISRRDASLGDAAAASEQLIAVQDIQVRLVHADALANENYLIGGIEDGSKRDTYEKELSAVSKGLIAVGNKVLKREADELAGVANSLSVYSGLIEQARANNRQGFPVGQAYLRQASDQLGGMVGTLRQVQASLRHQVNDSLDRADRAGVWLHAVGWPLFALLVTGGTWVALRFRRLVNVPLAIAVIGTLVVLVAGSSVQGSAMSGAESATGTSLHAADLAAQARSAAFDAHADEFRSLIARGGGDDSVWLHASNEAVFTLQKLCEEAHCDLQPIYKAYSDAHVSLNDLDKNGDWDGARESSLHGEARDAFQTFSTTSGKLASTLGSDAAVAMSPDGNGLGGLRFIVFIGGLLVAALTIAGYGQRLREFR